MKSKKLEVRSKRLTMILFFFIFLLLTSYLSLAVSADKWVGVDESVIEKFAKEHGREAREPLIIREQGDLLLFVFLIAGAVGGFAAGYYWRRLIEDGKQRTKSEANIHESLAHKGE